MDVFSVFRPAACIFKVELMKVYGCDKQPSVSPPVLDTVQNLFSGDTALVTLPGEQIDEILGNKFWSLITGSETA